MSQSINDQLITAINAQSPVSEQYRMLRTNIQFSSIDEQIQVIMVASAQTGEGRTTTVSNLAVTYAQENKKVLLIDMNLRKPDLHSMFQLSNSMGLTNILVNQYDWNEVVQETDIPHLYIITSGPQPPNPSDMLGSQKMKSLLMEWKEYYDVILIDVPPLLAFTEGYIVSSMCDGVILVVSTGKTKKESIKKAKASLDMVKARVLGAVLNHANSANLVQNI